MLHKDQMTVNGRTIWENVKDAACWNEEVIRPFDKALTASGGIAVLPATWRRTARSETLGGDAQADAAQRPRRRLREHRGLQGEDRRSNLISTRTA